MFAVNYIINTIPSILVQIKYFCFSVTLTGSFFFLSGLLQEKNLAKQQMEYLMMMIKITSMMMMVGIRNKTKVCCLPVQNNVPMLLVFFSAKKTV